MNREEWISRINQLNELELELQMQGTVVNIEWFRAMYGSRVPNRSWHYHRGTEIHYLMKGEIQVFFEDETIQVREGEAIVIPAGIRHRLSETAGQEHFYKIVVNYHLSNLGAGKEMSLLSRMLTPEARMRIAISEEMRGLLELSVNESIQKKYGFLSVIQGNLLSVLMLTARTAAGEQEIDYEIPKKKNIFVERMEQIDSFVAANLNRKLTVDEIARHMNLSSKQIGRTIFHCHGKNTQEYLMSVKLEKAKELLKNPEYSVGYIAELLGFCNEYYFNRFFKQMEGMPPGKYRKSVSSA